MNNFFVLFGFISKQEVKFSAPGEDSNALSAFSGEEEEEKEECGVQRNQTCLSVPCTRGACLSISISANIKRGRPAFSKS